MNALVGYTGFVGSSLWESGAFDAGYNSKNITEAFGTEPDLLVYAGVKAEKYLANNAPEMDLELIREAERNIAAIAPRKLVLISTIDVFKCPVEVDESSPVDTDGLHPYGLDRYLLEQWVRENYPDALIVRLPGLYGKNIRKNFIYDYLNVIPAMLKKAKFEELAAADPELRAFYTPLPNGFYKAVYPAEQKALLQDKFRNLGFSALNFTDSRGIYQFYGLSALWNDLRTALEADLRLFHPAVEPVSVSELYTFLTGGIFVNELPGAPARYDYRTMYDGLFGGSGGYIEDKQCVLRKIKEFTEQYSK